MAPSLIESCPSEPLQANISTTRQKTHFPHSPSSLYLIISAKSFRAFVISLTVILLYAASPRHWWTLEVCLKATLQTEMLKDPSPVTRDVS